ncbi:MAG: hypothetical protein M1829_002467 [Trizodia sp. TS-e1964]|nr:MAG: hypothetical protein M1829_002467 [Trizodia sp. TS-e1964]
MPFGCESSSSDVVALDPDRPLILTADDFNNISSFPLPSPPDPAPGPSLLDDHESTMLGNFFDHVGSATFASSNYSFDKELLHHGEGDQNFPWGNGFSSQFPGSPVSMPPQTISRNGLHQMNPALSNGHMVISPGNINISKSADMVTTPLAFQQNADFYSVPQGAAYSGQSANSTFTDPAPRNLSTHPTLPYAAMRTEGRRHSANSIQQLYRRPIPDFMTDPFFADMAYGNPPPDFLPQTTHSHMKATSTGLRWGSDGSFLDRGYVAPPNQDSVEAVERDLLQKLDCLEPQMSANNTNPSSPRPKECLGHQRNLTNGSEAITEGTAGEHEGEVAEEETEQDPRPRKRRKSRIKSEEHQQEVESLAVTRPRRGKASTNSFSGRTRRFSVPASTVKRRKSSPGGQKPTRENLTEEQKRSNHILSEQKRRNLIKQGFDDLCDLVPQLKGGNYSKSAMLLHAGDWLEDMLKGNEELERQLAALKELEGA